MRGIGAFWLCVGLLTAMLAAAASGDLPMPIHNLTRSMPYGDYWAQRLPDHLKRGDFVFVCPPAAAIKQIEAAGTEFIAGACPGHYAPFLKVIIAASGDHVRVTDAGIMVNDELLLNSRPVPSKALPRPEPTTLRAGDAWVWSPIAASVDSRYVGTVHPLALATPIGTISSTDRAKLIPRFLDAR
jgi:conjugative transfer signal peptidase TraF